MSDFVTKESFNELKGDVRAIGGKVDSICDRMTKVECNISTLPNLIVAEIIEKLYNSKDTDKVKKVDLVYSGAKWLAAAVIGGLITIII